MKFLAVTSCFSAYDWGVHEISREMIVCDL